MSAPHDNLLKGIGLALASHFCFAVMSLGVKIMADSYHVAEIVFFRNAGIFFVLAGLILYKRNFNILKPKHPRLVATRGILGIFSSACVFAAFANLPMSYASTLMFLSVFITPVLAVIFLKEPIGIHRWIAIVLGMAGVVCIASPSGEISIIGMACAIGAACIHGVSFAVMRGLKGEDQMTTTFYYVFIGAVLTACTLPFIGVGLTAQSLPYALLIASCGGIALYCQAASYRFAAAALITPLAYSGLLWSTLFDIFIWKDTDLNWFALGTGASLIICAQLYIIHRERRHRMKERAHA